MKISTLVFTAVVLAMLVAANTASAQVYKWVDDDGNVHFTDAPPPKQETEEVKIDNRPVQIRRSSASSSSSDEFQTDSEYCESAIDNLRRYAPIWARKVRAKMPSMSPSERSQAQAGLEQMESEMENLDSGLRECVREMKEPESREITICMANASNDTAAMYCVR